MANLEVCTFIKFYVQELKRSMSCNILNGKYIITVLFQFNSTSKPTTDIKTALAITYCITPE